MIQIDEKEYEKLLKMKEQLEKIRKSRNKGINKWREKNRDKYNQYAREYYKNKKGQK